MLIKTGDRKLVEHSPRDSYWGDGPDGKGLNMLGKLLMRVREWLIFVRDDRRQEELQKDHTSVLVTSDSSSQHLTIPSTYSFSPVDTVEDAQHSIPQADTSSSPVPVINVVPDKYSFPQAGSRSTVPVINVIPDKYSFPQAGT